MFLKCNNLVSILLAITVAYLFTFKIGPYNHYFIYFENLALFANVLFAASFPTAAKEFSGKTLYIGKRAHHS